MRSSRNVRDYAHFKPKNVYVMEPQPPPNPGAAHRSQVPRLKLELRPNVKDACRATRTVADGRVLSQNLAIFFSALFTHHALRLTAKSRPASFRGSVSNLVSVLYVQTCPSESRQIQAGKGKIKKYFTWPTLYKPFTHTAHSDVIVQVCRLARSAAKRQFV